MTGITNRRWSIASLFVMVLFSLTLLAQTKPPNIVVIFGDDIGYWNVGALIFLYRTTIMLLAAAI